MQSGAARPVTTEIVLVGGGHAHVAVVRAFGMKPEPGVRLTLVARDAFTPYSGMMPGHVAGHYDHDACHIDLGPLCQFAGVRLIHAPAIGLDPEARRLSIEGRPPLRYDLISLDIGSTTHISEIPGADACGIPIKPLDRFLERLEALERGLAFGAPICVAGGGAGGAELALALKYRLRHLNPTVTLVTDTSTLLPTHAPAVRRAMQRLLQRQGVSVITRNALAAVRPASVDLTDGTQLASAMTVLATGSAAPSWLAETGLALDYRGFIQVNESLVSVSHPNVFAAGDIACFTPRPLPKAGVYAVRQGPILAQNLRQAARGRLLLPFRPQRRFLSLLSGGGQFAVASYGGLAASGGWVWRWKDWIDRRWMQRYQVLPPMAAAKGKTPMRCAGCGSKIGGDVLARVMAGLDMGTASGVVTGAGDDAAVLQPPAGQMLVQSTDHFRAFTGDAFRFGRVAAEHALSDLFAMGASAHSVLVQVTVPFAAPGIQEADLIQVLTGATEAVRAAGAALIGGHTAEGPELSLGLTVNGFAAETELWHKSGAEVGDVLILTKPLGVGIVLAADMQGKARSAWVEAAFAAMLRSNRHAVPVLRKFMAKAVTDVTGFGLAGHLVEVMHASGVGAVVQEGALPLLPGVADLIAAGVESTLAPSNSLAAPHAPAIAWDPQTSGGLLAAVPADCAAACVRALKDAGYPDAGVIGRCVEGGALAFDG